jgi:hypothetical protein
MSSTGIKTDIYDNLEADIIDVNDSLFIKKINVLDFINDLSENLVDLSEILSIYPKILSIYPKMYMIKYLIYQEI